MGAVFTLQLKRVVDLTDGHIGLSSYPIFDPEYREGLNKKIRDHYWNREIGVESIDMFKFNLARKMNEIMPIYNPLYKSTLLEFDPLSTIDLRTVTTSDTSQTTENTGESTAVNETTGKTRSTVHDTPQMMLAANKDYATSGSDVKSDSLGDSTATETGNSTTDAEAQSETETKGYQGSPSELLQAYRATLLNVDMLIIADLAELFMLVWDNGDNYTEPQTYSYGYYY